MDIDARRTANAEIARSFDARAARYAGNEWHRHCAERLVALCRLRPGQYVLDAGTGTGFAALAAASAVGRRGRVRGIDLSAGMLREAHAAVSMAGLDNVDLVQADAVALADCAPGTFDVVTCVAGLLYMPVEDALRAWHRVLKDDGLLAFSTMRAGSPPGGRIFRECAAQWGVALRDPSEPLGSVEACQRALETGGFHVEAIVSEMIDLSAQDLTLAWESNLGSAGHADVHRLGDDALGEMKGRYLDALAREERDHPGAVGRSEVLYAFGRR